jgi:hypothetical protein
MNLDEAQVAKVRQWVDEGRKAAEVQTRLQEELGIKMTYAEVRFLLGDLQLKPKDLPKAATPLLGGGPAAGPAAASSRSVGAGPAGLVPGGVPAGGLKPVPAAEAGAGAGAGAGVQVTVDDIARPNMVVSGKVTFSDGQFAEWGIDQMGRPMLMPKQQGYRPSQPDVVEFQVQLEQILSRFGY